MPGECGQAHADHFADRPELSARLQAADQFWRECAPPTSPCHHRAHDRVCVWWAAWLACRHRSSGRLLCRGCGRLAIGLCRGCSARRAPAGHRWPSPPRWTRLCRPPSASPLSASGARILSRMWRFSFGTVLGCATCRCRRRCSSWRSRIAAWRRATRCMASAGLRATAAVRPRYPVAAAERTVRLMLRF